MKGILKLAVKLKMMYVLQVILIVRTVTDFLWCIVIVYHSSIKDFFLVDAIFFHIESHPCISSPLPTPCLSLPKNVYEPGTEHICENAGFIGSELFPFYFCEKFIF